jgi:hypothetical protein
MVRNLGMEYEYGTKNTEHICGHRHGDTVPKIKRAEFHN